MMEANVDISEHDPQSVVVETVRTFSEKETIAIGREFAARLTGGDVVALNGEFGSGKTQFVKGVCLGLGVVDVVTSPSFIIMNEYKGERNGTKPIPVFHFDFYRVRSLDEVYDLGVEEFLYGNGICLIEWAKAAASILPEKRYEVALDVLDDQNARDIKIERMGHEV
jgi:tRNA threonylcarbamoyladenosine biosynthesis protein TsaE